MKFRHSICSPVLMGLFLAIILVLGLVHPGPVFAANPTAQAGSSIVIDSIRVDIWPEFDQPSVLVIDNITLSPQVTLPATMTLRIPAAAGKPFAVAWQSSDNALYDLKYETAAAGNWLEIKFSAPSSNLRIEYYDPTIKKTGAHRDFTFHWPGDYQVNNLTLSIQQPAKATNLTIRPDAGDGIVGSDGLTYYTLAAGKVPAGTTFDLSMAYDNSSNALTNADQQVAQPAQPINNTTPGRVVLDQLLPWVIGGLGLLLIAAGLLWYWRTGSATARETVPSRPRHTARQSSPVSTKSASAGEGTFCHECGKRSAPGDVFCRACGTKLR